MKYHQYGLFETDLSDKMISQASAVPFTPKLVESRESNVEWSIVSNAALRSSDTRRVG